VPLDGAFSKKMSITVPFCTVLYRFVPFFNYNYKSHVIPPWLPPYSHLTPALLPPYSCLIPTLFPLTPTLFPPYSRLTPALLPPYSHLSPTWVPPHSHLTPTWFLRYFHLVPTLLDLIPTSLPTFRLYILFIPYRYVVPFCPVLTFFCPVLT